MAKTSPKGKKPNEPKKRKLSQQQSINQGLLKKISGVSAGMNAHVSSQYKAMLEMNKRITALEKAPTIIEDGNGGFVAKLSDGSTFTHQSPLASPEREEQKWVPKMGDWVVVTGPAGIMGTDTFRGKVGHIKAYETTHNVSAWYVPELDAWFDASNIRLASPAEVQAYEEQQARAKQAEEEAKPLVICNTLVRYAGHDGVYLGPHGTQYEIGRPNGTGTWTVSICSRKDFTVIDPKP